MKKTFSKIAGSVAVVALALTIVVAPASALTAADIQLLVSMGVIPADKAAAAMAALGGTTTPTSCGTYTRDITLGSTGADVVSLQTYLESKGHLVIPTGVSKGYFGALTQTALAKYQVSMGISPAAGYFGPVTRAKISADCSTTTTPTTPTTPGTGLSGDEASLEDFDLSSGDDSEVEEDQSADIAEIEFDVEDGDVMLDRVDLSFVNASSTSNTDIWDVLEEVELVIDGDVVGSASLSDEDDYLDEDDGTVRISGIDTVIEEGETVTIIVRVTAQSNVDSDDLIDIEVNVEEDGIRATDAVGIQQYIGDDSDTVEFEVVEAGDGEELNVSSSSSDPDATTLKVEDNKKSDLHTIFVFDVEAEENDIEIDTVQITIETSAAVSSVVADYVLEIDGEEFDDWSYTTSSSTATELVVEFDIDGDFTIDEDDEVEFVLWAEFNAANGANYSTGATIQASIDDNDIEGEGADDVISDGTATGEEHILATEGIVVPANGVTTSTDTQGDNDTVGIFTIEFEVTAFEEDFYIADNASSTDRTVSTGGVEYASLGSGTTSATLSSTAEDTAGVFKIEEGETETFTLTVTFDPAAAGQYRLTLEEIWASSSNIDGITGSTVTTVNATDFRTAYENINQ